MEIKVFDCIQEAIYYVLNKYGIDLTDYDYRYEGIEKDYIKRKLEELNIVVEDF